MKITKKELGKIIAEAISKQLGEQRNPMWPRRNALIENAVDRGVQVIKETLLSSDCCESQEMQIMEEIDWHALADQLSASIIDKFENPRS